MSYRVCLITGMGESNCIKGPCKSLGFNNQVAKQGERFFFTSKSIVHNFWISFKYNRGNPQSLASWRGWTTTKLSQ